MSNMTANVQAAWNEVVRKIGGKRISKMSVTSWVNDENKCTFDEFFDVIILKSHQIRIYTYNPSDRQPVCVMEDFNIIQMDYKETAPGIYTITFFDGAYWKLDIEL